MAGRDLGRIIPRRRGGETQLKARQYRQRSLKDLSYLFALSKDEDEKTKFREALQRFPAELPYEYEFNLIVAATFLNLVGAVGSAGAFLITSE